jgi:hypothetical protein
LAKRQDRRALPALIVELSQPEMSVRVIDAAEAFLSETGRAADRSPDHLVAALKERFSF